MTASTSKQGGNRLSVAGGRLMLLACASFFCLRGSALATGSVNAVPVTEQIAEALSGAKPASRTCPVNANGPVVAGQAPSTFSQADLSCAVSVSEALSLLNEPDSILVDTRNREEFASFQISGSLNLPLPAIRHKDFLREKTIVLVGSGKSERLLYETCFVLKKNSFKNVKVLQGGVLAWLTSGQPILGRSPSLESLAQLSPEELWAESQFDANIVLLGSAQREVRDQLPRASLLADDSLVSIRHALDVYAKPSKKPTARDSSVRSAASVIWVAPKAVSTEVIASVRLAVQPLPLLIYRESAEELRRYISTQNLQWAAQSRGPKQPKCGL